MSNALSPWHVTRALPMIAGESLDGYVARVAAAHHMPRIADITEVTGEIQLHRSNASFCDEVGLQILADCLRTSPEAVRLHSPLWSPDAKLLNFFGTLVPRDFLQFSYRRFSPKALSVSSHHRGLWQFRQLPVCTETWEYLEERCPNLSCRRRQIWRRTSGPDLCDYCAEPLRRAQAIPIPERLRESLKMLVDLLHHDPKKQVIARRHLSPALAHLDGGNLLELACVLAPVIDGRVASVLKRRSLCLDSARNIIVPAVAATWPFLAGWPSAIEQHVAAKLNVGGREKGGSTRKAFYNVLGDRNDSTLSSAVQKVLGQLDERCRAARSRGVTIAEMTKLTCADRRTLFEMRKAGKFPSFLALDGIKLQVLVDRAAVLPMIAMNKPRQRLIHAAQTLGVPTYAIREMVNLGCLEAASIPPGRGDYLQLAACSDSVRSFQDKLYCRLLQEDNQHPINLSEAMRQLGGGPKPWARTLKAIAEGELSARATNGKASLAHRILIGSEGAPSLRRFQDLRDMDWRDCIITISDLAEIMNIRPAHFSRNTEFLLGPGPAGREVTMDTAERLARTYVSTGELSRRLGLHPRAAHYLARSQKVTLASPGLFMREEAERLIPGLACHGPRVEADAA